MSGDVKNIGISKRMPTKIKHPKWLTKQNAILSLFLLLALAYLVWTIVIFVKSRNMRSTEHFTEMEVASDSISTAYDARLTTINVFQQVIGRKPTAEEITQYSMHGNEQDILTAIMDNKSNISSSVPSAPSSSPSSVPSVADPSTQTVEKEKDQFVSPPPSSSPSTSSSSSNPAPPNANGNGTTYTTPVVSNQVTLPSGQSAGTMNSIQQYLLNIEAQIYSIRNAIGIVG